MSLQVGETSYQKLEEIQRQGQKNLAPGTKITTKLQAVIIPLYSDYILHTVPWAPQQKERLQQTGANQKTIKEVRERHIRRG